jgi:hypothetical protein
MAMNQLEILGELQQMHEQLDFYRWLNAKATDDKVAQGATFAYSSSCRHLDRLIQKILAEGVEINESDIQTTSAGGDSDTD